MYTHIYTQYVTVILQIMCNCYILRNIHKDTQANTYRVHADIFLRQYVQRVLYTVCLTKMKSHSLCSSVVAFFFFHFKQPAMHILHMNLPRLL